MANRRGMIAAICVCLVVMMLLIAMLTRCHSQEPSEVRKRKDETIETAAEIEDTTPVKETEDGSGEGNDSSSGAGSSGSSSSDDDGAPNGFAPSRPTESEIDAVLDGEDEASVEQGNGDYSHPDNQGSSESSVDGGNQEGNRVPVSMEDPDYEWPNDGVTLPEIEA